MASIKLGRRSRTAAAGGRIRVALVAPTLNPGGAERQMLYLASALPRETFELRFVLLSERGALAAEAEALGIPVYVLGLNRESCRGLRPQCLRSALGALARYRHLTRGVQIVDAWTVPAYTFAGLARPFARVPVVMAGRRSLADVRRTKTLVRETARSLAMRHVDAVVANSQAAASESLILEGIRASRMHVIRNAVIPIVTPDADRVRLREAWGFGAQDLVVGCVATLRPGKGHDLLLEVATDLRDQYPQLRYVFTGSGPAHEWIHEQIRARGLEGVVVIHGGEADARRIYGAFDIVVQASESEGLPNAVLEAAAAGRPIVATSVGGTAEILTSEKDGLLVPKCDRTAMATAIGRLAHDPGLRQLLGKAAADRSREFSVDKLVVQTSSLYLRLLDGSTAGSGPGGPGKATPAREESTVPLRAG